MMGESIEEFINHFRGKYQNMQKASELQEDVTQGFWQSLSLSERRTRRKNLRITYEVKERGNRRGTLTEEEEGNYRQFTFKRPVTLERTFYLDDRKVKTIKENVDEECIVLQGKEETFKVVCPRCNAVANKDSFLDGCDYCGSKFQIKQFGMKVAGYQFLRDFSEGAKKILVMAILSFVILAIALGSMAVLRVVQNTVGVTSLFTTLLYGFCNFLKFVVSKVVAVGVVIAYLSLQLGRKRTYVMSSVRSREAADYQFEEIATGLEYRLKQIHFAENESEIQAFVMEDMSRYLPIYKDIIDLSLYRCIFTSYKKENGFEHLSAYGSLSLLVEENGKIKERKEHIWIGLRRNEHYKEADSNLAYNICPNCNSTISLLNGGVCEYCGEQLNLIDYDWIIGSADTSPEKAARVMSGKFFDERKFVSKGLLIMALILSLVQAPVVWGLGVTTKNVVTGLYQEPFVFNYDVIPSPYDAGLDIRKASIQHSTNAYTREEADLKYEVNFGYVSNKEKVMWKYAAFLQEKDGFSVSKESTEGAICLERAMRLKWGKTKITFFDDNGLYLEVEQILY